MRKETETVRRFYDSHGWQKDKSGLYKDTAFFVDTRPVLAWYDHAIDKRINPFFGRGKYFLDAGSGANPYLQTSGYERHVCVDISETALKEARSKLQTKGWYVVADLAHLPFRDGIFDATLSAHVLYHVAKEEQHSVIFELHRALAPKGVCVIIYTQFTNLVHLIPAPFRQVGRMLRSILGNLKLLKGTHHGDGHKENSGEVPALYSYAHDVRWFRRILPRGWNVEIRSLTSIDYAFTKRFIPNNLFGRYLTMLIFLLETLFPRALARIGYQMIIIRKE